MTTILVREPPKSSFLARSLGLAYGTFAYLVFLGTFLYAIGFVGGVVVPKTIDNGVPGLLIPALFVNTLLLGIFAIQHSGMARRGFKAVLTKFVSPVIERSTFVLMSSMALILLFAYWQPMPQIVWQTTNPHAAFALKALSAVGWFIVLYATFLISHFELFGLKQVSMNFAGRVAPMVSFKSPGLYRFVRHPIYLGFTIAFWATPKMTAGHALFAFGTTAYILIGIWLEERDLVAAFGEEYKKYRANVAMLLPGIKVRNDRYE
jgi:protein-S-isoprenylcysteine O-methyltransferase Ste14